MNFQKALWFITCVLLMVSCVPSSRIQTPIVNTVTVVKPDAPTLRPAESYDCHRPYADTSLWNVPLDWSKARLHPNSKAMVAAFFKSNSWIGSDTSQFAPNIYFVTDETPPVPVILWPDRSFRNAIDDKAVQMGVPGATVWVPLPSNAKPAPGTDGELAVINMDSGEEWGLINGSIISPNRWSAGGVYRYHIRNSGVPPKGFAQRGAGIGSFAGIIRPCEVERGYIGHAVTIAYDFPCAPGVCQTNGWPDVIPPFTKTDGKGTEQFDLPEGARLVIRPDITKDEIIQACAGVKGCIVWALNMQEYGGFIVDDSDHPKTYAEGDATANWDKTVWSAEMLKNIPPNWYAVLDWNYPSTTLP